MALKGRDKAIRDRFTRDTAGMDKANAKKFDAIRNGVEGIARQLHELLPDDHQAQDFVLKPLDDVVDEAASLFKKRSAPPPVAKKQVIKTQPLRTEANPHGRPTPVVEKTADGHAVEVGAKLPEDLPRTTADAATA